MISPEILRRFALFSGQDAVMLEQIAMLGGQTELEAGEWLFHQEEPAEKLFLLLDGGVELIINFKDELSEQVATLNNSDVIGWSSLIHPHKYTLAARAVQNSKFVYFNGSALRTLMDENPAFGYVFIAKIAEIIGERLTGSYIRLGSLTVQG